MNGGMADRLVIVSARPLADMLELVDRALPTLDDRLRDALAGAAAEVRVEAMLDLDHLTPEPVPA